MCTITWLVSDNGYELFFNRDESRRRLIAYPPARIECGGVACIAPIDADAGGTWLGVNAYGLSVALVNGYGPAPPRRQTYTSRGLLVRWLLDCPAPSLIPARLQGMDLNRFRPFTLLTLAPGGALTAHHWSGPESTLQAGVLPECPLISSAIRSSEVAQQRRRQFAALGTPDENKLFDFHRSHEPEAGPLSVCMHREDARTVSLSRVSAGPESIAFHYTPGPPCTAGWLPPVTLARQRREVGPDAV